MRTIGTRLLLLGLCIGIAPSLYATVNFGATASVGGCSTGSSGSGSDGNTRCFTDNGGAFKVTATAWATPTGQSTGVFANAALGLWTGNGLGVCSDYERSSGSTNGTTCDGSSPVYEHAIGNGTSYDFVLLTFSQTVLSASLTLSTFGTTQDTDITYFVGSCAVVNGCSPSGKNATLSSLDDLFAAGKIATYDNIASSLNGTRTVDLNLAGTGGSGINWVLIGATTLNGYTGNDIFKLRYMDYSIVPEPATFGMAGIALLALGAFRARKKRSAAA